MQINRAEIQTHQAPRRSSRRGLSACVLLLALLTGCQPQPAALPQAAAGTSIPSMAVEGKVATVENGRIRPAVGVRVSLSGSDRVALTDAEGRYRLEGVPFGAQHLVAHHEDFVEAELPIWTSRTGALTRANLLLRPRAYSPLQAAAFDAGLAGVVFDPRGAALPGAALTLASSAANGGRGARVTVTADDDGYFTAALPNVTSSGAAPTVRVEARGTSPGGIPLQTVAPIEEPLTAARHVLNIQATGLPTFSTPAIDGPSFVLPGQEARLQVSPLSTRADEFYIRLTSGDATFEALPLAIAGNVVSFRVPLGLPAGGFEAAVVPFGQVANASAPTPEYLSRYTQAELDADLTLSAAPTLVDVTTPAGTLNSALFVGGDQARLALTLANASDRVRQPFELTGQVPVGTAIAAVTVGGSPWPTEAIEGPSGSGTWRLRQLTMPLAGPLPIEVLFTSPLRLTPPEGFGLAGLAIEMPSLGLNVAPPPAPPALVTSGLNAGALTVTKAIRDEGTLANGIGQVVVTITPTGSSALGAFKLTDVTRTEVASSATAAAFTGTTAMPAAGTPLGLATDEHLDLKVDGGATQVVRIFGANYDAETLIGQINTTTGLSGLVTAARSGSAFSLERVAQGPTRTLEILATSSPNVLAKLGLSPGLKASGYLADLGAVRATQPGGTAWAVTTVSNAWTGGTGTQSVNLTLRPPAAYAPGDGPTQPITLVYPIRKYNGLPATLGGGTAATFGARVTSFNLLAPFTDASKDQTLGKTAPDGATTAGL